MKILKIGTEKRRIGDVGEKAAAHYLRRHGYKIRERNFCAAGYEIDLVAEDREHYVFVEVKTRTEGKEDPREPRPASAVTPEKQRKIIAASKFYYPKEKLPKRRRFDIVEVWLNDKKKAVRISHLVSAFTYDTSREKRQ